MARTARTEQIDGVGEITVHGIDQLDALLPDAEIVVLSLPANDDTHHLFDAERIVRMAPGALLVNVGRGPLIETDALVPAPPAPAIRAASDVFGEGPLPAGHPLWTAPGLLITPHGGGASTAMNPRIARLIRRQIERMLAGEPPVNIVLPGS